MEDKNIYDMELHERIFIQSAGFYVVRVPGGWIYIAEFAIHSREEIVFVPFNEEFKVEISRKRVLYKIKNADEKSKK